MYKIGVIGDEDSVLGFSSIGIDVFSVEEDREKVRKKIEELVENDYSIIYITEKMSLLVEDYLLKYREKQIPAIITIPSSSGRLHLGSNKVRECAKKAIGIDIFNNKEGEEI